MLNKQSRREFLKISSTAAIAATVYPWVEIFGNNDSSKKPSDKVRLGFIGVGVRGATLLLNVKELSKETNVEIAAVCDDYPPNYDRAIELAENSKVKAFVNYHKLLEMKDLDGVIIATPLHEHTRIAVEAMEAGFHVFCEKAMARTLDDIKKMYDTHVSTGMILQIGHQRMFDPKYIKAIEMIKNGEIGKIGQIRAYWHRNNDWKRPLPKGKPELEHKINWRLYKKYSAGLITELASHQIQVANWILNNAPISVMGTGSIVYWKDGREVHDNVALIFSYDDGTQFVWDSMTSNRKYGCEEQIMGDKATMEIGSNKIFLENPPPAPGIRQMIHEMELGLFEIIPIGGATWIPETPVKYEGEYISDKYELNETLLQLEAFVNYIRKGKAPEQLTIEGYNASIWSILAEEAVDKGLKLTMPGKYIL